MIKPWIYLFIASIFETGWTFSLKYMNFGRLKDAFQQYPLISKEFSVEFFPLLGYIFFGVANIYCLSVAFKDIPTATALAVWTACSLILVKLFDVFYYKTPTNLAEVFFMSLIVVGIIGLKKYAAS
ncbi:hypothetical protein G9H64_00100 [Aquirufa nivalisilvae]|uniref:Guanidinium exporter n=1 Tax=Aquirufa nivalisilvae TaxID=2516557 RepID=A0A2S2DS83_9BACT|nr:SMR family transporter [Aquirufa nivalisilvae]AWL08162.1 hypothetical protein HME7025_00279 [Aquirufa nivalisilvae]MCZ2479349.1 hypothetical protein [Aquirufa nivalisilvae]MCZ2481339.1 hypothetical protein [Aquirufa nivalisilvae]